MRWFTYFPFTHEPMSTDVPAQPWSASAYSTYYGLSIDDWNIEELPARDISFFSIAGRNGSTAVDNGSFEDLLLSIKVNLITATSSYASTFLAIDAIKQWLVPGKYAQTGETLEHVIAYDHGGTTRCRIGVFTGNISFVLNQLESAGRATLTFRCRPEWFAVEDVRPENFTGGLATTTRPYNLQSYPYLSIKIVDSTETDIEIAATGGGTIKVPSLPSGSADGTLRIDLYTGEVYYFKQYMMYLYKKVPVPFTLINDITLPTFNPFMSTEIYVTSSLGNDTGDIIWRLAHL